MAEDAGDTRDAGELPPQLAEARSLMLDLGARRGCDGLLGRMMTIHGEGCE